MNINTMTFALNPKPFGNSSGESQRDSATKPRVARDELPWVKVAGVSQPQRGCGLVALPLLVGRNPFRVVIDRTHDPRVARSSQPWALLRNPVGIGELQA